MKELSIILPVHNEENGIKDFIDKLVKSIKKLDIDFEILCVENGSTDDSLRELQKINKKYSQVVILQSEKGWGNAVRKGIEKAKGIYLCFMVSDGQVDPSLINELYNEMRKGNTDLVKITRKNRENRQRLINSRIYNLLARLMFGFTSPDINATPKLIKTSLIKSLNLKSENIALDIELLYKLRNRRMSWREIPANSFSRQQGKSTTNLKAVFEMLQNMIRLRFTGDL